MERHSEEFKKKMSKLHKGKNNPFYGRKHSKEEIEKMLESRKGYRHSEETKKKISLANKGIRCSEEAKIKISLANKGRPKHSEEVKKRMSENRKGEKCYIWKGGKSFEPYGLDFNNELKEQIRKQDGYRCQECFRHQNELKRKLDIHHIDFVKKHNNAANLISLCNSCHSQTNFDRDKWINYFSNRLVEDGKLEVC